MQLSARARLQSFGFCSVSDLGACLAVSRSWNADSDSEVTWAIVYERTQRPVGGLPGGDFSQRALIERPFGKGAVGWRLAVLVEDHQPDGNAERYRHGRITAYDPDVDAYLVAYDGNSNGTGRQDATATQSQGGDVVEMWETERMAWSEALRSNPSLAGKSRFVFLAPPGGCWPDTLAGSACAPSAASSAGSEHFLRFGSWKRELKHSVQNAPTRLLQRLEAHRHEVLYLAFAPCGTMFASCSRDCRTLIFRRSGGVHGLFQQEAELQHRTAACRCAWWPGAIDPTLVVTTEDTSYQGFHGASFLELWSLSVGAREHCSNSPLEQQPTAATCVHRVQNQPFDIHTAMIPCPDGAELEQDQQQTQQMQLENCDSVEPLCFISGRVVLFDASGRHVQWLDVWPGPTHPEFCMIQSRPNQARPLARLRAECGANYLHALQAGPDTNGRNNRRLLALTGSTPLLCDSLALADLSRLTAQPGAVGLMTPPLPVYDVALDIVPLVGRIVLSARWSRCSRYFVVNTRPYADADQGLCSRASHNGSARSADWRRPAPDLSTSIELLLFDTRSLDCVGSFDGHYAFTTKECPFTIFTDDWSDGDFLASGSEDCSVCVWNRRQQRLVRRLQDHSAPVNAVSWNGSGLLASASDDYSVSVWTVPSDSGRDSSRFRSG